MDGLSNLGPVERAKRYRDYAQQMLLLAAQAVTEETRSGYRNMAADWLDMAQKLEAEYGEVSGVAGAPQVAPVSRRTR
jgi:hypothetical protein